MDRQWRIVRIKQYEGKLATLSVINGALQNENDKLRLVRYGLDHAVQSVLAAVPHQASHVICNLPGFILNMHFIRCHFCSITSCNSSST